MNVLVADLEVEELAWVVCVANAGFEVLLSEWSSLLHLILEDSIKYVFGTVVLVVIAADVAIVRGSIANIVSWCQVI